MTSLLLDTDSLIKLTKAGLKEVIVQNFIVTIPLQVKKESIDQAKEKPDALIIEKNIMQNHIKVEFTHKNDEVLERQIKELNIQGGEQDVYRLYIQKQYDLISSDDQKFLKTLHLLNKNAITPASLIVFLYKRKKMNQATALKMLENLRIHVSMIEYDLSKKEIGG